MKQAPLLSSCMYLRVPYEVLGRCSCRYTHPFFSFSGMKHPGVRTALKLDSEAAGTLPSEVVPMTWKIGALSDGLHLKKKTVWFTI